MTTLVRDPETTTKNKHKYYNNNNNNAILFSGIAIQSQRLWLELVLHLNSIIHTFI